MASLKYKHVYVTAIREYLYVFVDMDVICICIICRGAISSLDVLPVRAPQTGS